VVLFSLQEAKRLGNRVIDRAAANGSGRGARPRQALRSLFGAPWKVEREMAWPPTAVDNKADGWTFSVAGLRIIALCAFEQFGFGHNALEYFDRTLYPVSQHSILQWQQLHDFVCSVSGLLRQLHRLKRDTFALPETMPHSQILSCRRA
jgi:hypothetical protein